MLSDDFQLKLIIAILTVCFTGIFAIGGFLAKKLIDDIGTKLDTLVKKQEGHDQSITTIKVQQKEHEMDIKHLKEKFSKIVIK
jgi:low affinity Fe/Cu permease